MSGPHTKIVILNMSRVLGASGTQVEFFLEFMWFYNFTECEAFIHLTFQVLKNLILYIEEFTCLMK